MNMTDNMQRARELLAAEYEKHGRSFTARTILSNPERVGEDFNRALLREAAAALEAAQEDACVALVADIRFACGDNGKRMQPELVEFIRGLARDAQRYRWLRDGGLYRVGFDSVGSTSLGDLDTAIDAARREG